MNSKELTFEDGLVVAAIRSIVEDQEKEVIAAAKERDFDGVKLWLKYVDDGKFPVGCFQILRRVKLDEVATWNSLHNLGLLRIITPHTLEGFFVLHEERLAEVLAANFEEVLQ